MMLIGLGVFDPDVRAICLTWKKIEALRHKSHQSYHRSRLSVIQKASGSVAVRLLCGQPGSKAANSRLPNVILPMHKATGALCNAQHKQHHKLIHPCMRASRSPHTYVMEPVSQKASGGRSTSTHTVTVTVRLLASAFFPRPLHNIQFQDFPNAHFNMHPAREQKRRATWCEKRGGNTVQYEFNLFSKITNHASAPIRKANAAKVGCAGAPAAAPQQTKKEKLWEKEISFWPALDDSYTGRPGQVDYFERRATRSERFMYRDRHCARTSQPSRVSAPRGIRPRSMIAHLSCIRCRLTTHFTLPPKISKVSH
ncbi:hypothetical protein V8C40DRAFT_278902 [Trichoderma camerunense]